MNSTTRVLIAEMLFALDYVWVDGVFAALYADGSIELYCDGDVRIPLKTWKKLGNIADRFMWKMR
jgi:hypothetical protein